jgi:single-strand DNA-binding protein
VIFSEGLADVAEKYLKKGSKILLEGALQTRKWTDKEGVERYSTEIVLQGYGCTLKMLDARKDGEASEPATTGAPPLDDEIPF